MPEPKGKLDAMTGYSFSTPVRSGRGWVRSVVTEVVTARKANGPEGLRPVFDGDAWERVDWLSSASGMGPVEGFSAMSMGPPGRQ